MKTKIAFLLFFLLLFFNSIFALQHYPGNWDDVTIQLQRNQTIYYFKTRTIINFDLPKTKQQLVRPAVSVIVNNKLSLWLGYDYLKSLYFPSLYFQSIWEQAEYKLISSGSVELTSQSRLQQRFSSLHAGTLVTFRQMLFLRFKHAFPSNKIFPVLYDEVFLELTHPHWAPTETLSQNRLYFGFNVACNKEISFLFGYLNRTIFGSHRTIMDHILYLSLDFYFGRKNLFLVSEY